MNTLEPRIIKKYPNRRLYDTAISSYITLEDVKRLVIEQVQIKVIDARTQEDITHSTLLQIIIEQEENGPSLFTNESLQQMIRSYGGIMQQMVSKMFTQGMDIFSQQQTFFKKGNMSTNESLEKEKEKDPLVFVADIAKKNMTHWQDLQQQWMDSFLMHMQKTQGESQPIVDEVDCDAVQSPSMNEKNKI